jgi:hypothetical protein
LVVATDGPIVEKAVIFILIIITDVDGQDVGTKVLSGVQGRNPAWIWTKPPEAKELFSLLPSFLIQA